MNKPLKNVLNQLALPESFDSFHIINPENVPLNLTARLCCIKCGLY